MRTVIGLVLSLVAAVGAADESVAPTVDATERVLRDSPRELGIPEPVRNDPRFAPDVDAVVRASDAAIEANPDPLAELTSTRAALASTAPATASAPLVRILVTQALSEAVLRDLMRASSADPRLVLVLRGMRAGQSFGALARQLRELARGLDPAPSIELDPTRFEDVVAAPVAILYDGDTELARVDGLATAGWLREAVERGERGALGRRGPTVPVEEEDLIGLMQQRAARVDWAAQQRRALSGYLLSLPMLELPRATKARRRSLDPTFTVAVDIVAPDGRLIARAGERVNPLERLPFTQRVVVFDPADPRQLAFAQREANLLPAATLIVSRIDRDVGLDQIAELTQRFRRRVTLLNAPLAERFALEHLPSVIVAEAGRFVVTEHVPEDIDAEP